MMMVFLVNVGVCVIVVEPVHRYVGVAHVVADVPVCIHVIALLVVEVEEKGGLPALGRNDVDVVVGGALDVVVVDDCVGMEVVAAAAAAVVNEVVATMIVLVVVAAVVVMDVVVVTGNENGGNGRIIIRMSEI